MAESELQFVVAQEEAGTRLDRYVADKVPELSRSLARQLIEGAHVRLNAHAARPSALVRAGDTVDVQVPEPQPIELTPEAIPLNVVYEDADVAVIDKAAGMVVHPAPAIHPARW